MISLDGGGLPLNKFNTYDILYSIDGSVFVLGWAIKLSSQEVLYAAFGTGEYLVLGPMALLTCPQLL